MSCAQHSCEELGEVRAGILLPLPEPPYPHVQLQLTSSGQGFGDKDICYVHKTSSTCSAWTNWRPCPFEGLSLHHRPD